MYRFFVPAEQIFDGFAEIVGDDVNHIRNVLRMENGEKVVISCGQGIDYYCIIKDVQAQCVVLDIVEETPVTTELPVKLVLFQALPKADKMELIIQKAIELGAYEVVPVRTKRSVVKLDEKKAAKKQQRWQAIAEAAAKQSGRGIVPQIHEVVSFSEALSMAKELAVGVIPYELYDDMEQTTEVLEQICDKESIGIFIGPEGGFERGEVEKAMEAGIQPISLGKRILRTETAGLAILSVLMFRIESQK
nr:16S rRNA (uracil(1498)-N(3))-methyltransferase [Eubacterium sp.]